MRRLPFLNRKRARPERQPDPVVDLETCLVCRKDFVNPVDWEPLDGGRWWMLLRCGECDTWRQVTVTDAVAARYDAELDRRIEALEATVAQLDRDAMAGDVEKLVVALRRGLLDPTDFAR